MSDTERGLIFQRVFWVITIGTLVLAFSIGIRLTFGLWLQPMSQAYGWGREVFAFAIALQNLVWGASQPFAGALADRFGTNRVVALGGLGYALGVYLMASSDNPLELSLTTGLIIGFSLSATSFAVVLGGVGRAVSEKRRSLALGVASSGGSIGQFVMLPIASQLISGMGWYAALGALSLFALVMVPLAAGMGGKPAQQANVQPQRLGEALSIAIRHRGYLLLTGGFFVCGFHVTFIATHLPAYIVDQGLPLSLGATALGLVGFCNILGSYFWGYMGGVTSKKNSLSALYFVRAIVFSLFLFFPVTQTTVLLFAGAMGFLWLGTVPLTNGLVGQMFGTQHVGTLFGIVFFSHQVGAFLGVWLGGFFYDSTGSYDLIWYASIALGLISALFHWPIDERPVNQIPTPATQN